MMMDFPGDNELKLTKQAFHDLLKAALKQQLGDGIYITDLNLSYGTQVLTVNFTTDRPGVEPS